MNMRFVFGDHERFKKRAKIYAAMVVLLLAAAFGVSPLGSFFVWIFAGATVFTGCMCIYFLVLSSQAKYPYRKKVFTKQDKETEEHIRRHLPILISLMLGGVLIVLLLIFFLGTG